MQNLPEGQWDEHGCFVYQVLKKLAVRKFTNVGDEHRTDFSFDEILLDPQGFQPARTGLS
jgi:hypothetical protein